MRTPHSSPFKRPKKEWIRPSEAEAPLSPKRADDRREPRLFLREVAGIAHDERRVRRRVLRERLLSEERTSS